ncbi:MAG: cytochrome bd-I oxidase subunit CydX [Candidatus Competibacterales bacterium]
MWYFAWILGVLLACALGVINALWLETRGFPNEKPGDEGPTEND